MITETTEYRTELSGIQGILHDRFTEYFSKNYIVDLFTQRMKKFPTIDKVEIRMYQASHNAAPKGSLFGTIVLTRNGSDIVTKTL